ncbi:MAG: type II toxin-antitoxin system VapC family toxin [Sulfobacillus sp.]
MATFVDTSGILTLLNRSEGNHAAASTIWEALVDAGGALTTSSFVLVETYALLQRRFGLEAVQTFHEEILPLLDVHWIDDATFTSAATALLVAGRRQLSLVDCVSFVLMRRLGIDTAFAWDLHFEEQGFHLA